MTVKRRIILLEEVFLTVLSGSVRLYTTVLCADICNAPMPTRLKWNAYFSFCHLLIYISTGRYLLQHYAYFFIYIPLYLFFTADGCFWASRKCHADTSPTTWPADSLPSCGTWSSTCLSSTVFGICYVSDVIGHSRKIAVRPAVRPQGGSQRSRIDFSV